MKIWLKFVSNNNNNNNNKVNASAILARVPKGHNPGHENWNKTPEHESIAEIDTLNLICIYSLPFSSEFLFQFWLLYDWLIRNFSFEWLKLYSDLCFELWLVVIKVYRAQSLLSFLDSKQARIGLKAWLGLEILISTIHKYQECIFFIWFSSIHSFPMRRCAHAKSRFGKRVTSNLTNSNGSITRPSISKNDLIEPFRQQEH